MNENELERMVGNEISTAFNVNFQYTDFIVLGIGLAIVVWIVYELIQSRKI